MSLRGKKLGLLLSTRPDTPNFRHGVHLAEAALAAELKVYLYCIDDAVHGVGDTQLQSLKACAYAARRRNVPVNDLAAFAGLSVVSDLMSGTDRFLSFN
jgi:hypothetical protein